MVKWFIDKESKAPLYLQLRELIRYYISTGAIQVGQRMPTVKDLSKRLEINSETLRKTYKELEREGLLETKRGKGTFASGRARSKDQARQFTGAEMQPLASVKDLFKRLLQKGVPPPEIRIIVEQAFNEVLSETSNRVLVFTECSVPQTREISRLLANHLDLPVEPVLLKDLKQQIIRMSHQPVNLLAVLTTGFHMNEVRRELAGLPVKIDFLITNMSLQTRRELAELDRTARYGFICRDRESIPFYKDMLRAELFLTSEIDCCVLAEKTRVETLLKSVDALLVSPPVYNDIKELAPPGLPIFNVFNRVDPMSLMIIKEKILGLW